MDQDDPLHAMPIAQLNIYYSLDDQGNPTHGVSHEGIEDKITLLGMLEMAKNTIMSPDWDDQE